MLHHKYLTGFWICLGFLFWINQSSEYAGVTQNICLNNFWTCQNISKYVSMCLNLFEWLLFYFLIVIPCLLECMVTYFIVYMKLDFFYSSWKNLICFLFDYIFLPQVMMYPSTTSKSPWNYLKTITFLHGATFFTIIQGMFNYWSIG